MNPIKNRAGLGLINFLVMSVFLGHTLYAQEGEHYPKFSLRLSGQAEMVALGDINTALRSFNRNPAFEYIRHNNPSWGAVEGNIDSLGTFFPGWEVELRMDLSRRIGLGVSAAGGLRAENESALTLLNILDVTWTYEYAYKPTVWIRPQVRLSLYYFPWRRGRVSSFIGAGIGYYRGGLSEQRNFMTINGYSGDVSWVKRYWETETRSTLGFHLGGGLEWHLSRPVSLIAEIQYRYARIGPLKGLEQTETGEPSFREMRGYLYFFTREDLYAFGQRHADLEVWDVPPDYSVDFIMDIRKARLDLSGVSLKLGIKIGLF